MEDQNFAFLKQFIELYQDLINHDGYGDMTVSVRLVQGGNKEVSLLCGREYRYQIGNPAQDKHRRRFKVVPVRGNRHAYTGPERRSGSDRRQEKDRRDQQGVPRNFRLERRVGNGRRSGKGRRWDD
ncbi:MAG: hypothetical protein MI754_01485 [Chromatiales bacterium]|nr:hypothetical protein [Chromatiales bacterium]